MTHSHRLVADIGATNARFQICRGTRLIGEPVVLPTADYHEASRLLRDAVAALQTPLTGDAVLAIAGPGERERDIVEEIVVTNGGLRFIRTECQGVLGCATTLINDFQALATGAPYWRSLAPLGGGPPRSGAKAVLGPGSGLGMAALVPLPEGGWYVVASEGGHADLAPGNPLEAELWSILARSHVQVSWETVLCGDGLVRLYVAMSELWGSRPEPLTAERISTLGVAMQDPVCHQTLETFCALLGAAAGNLALTMCATGGVYLAGGIVPRLLEFLETSPFRRRFDECGDLSDFARDIPVYVVTEQNPGLLGAAYC